MDAIFDWCVKLLYAWSGMLGITYEEINVIIFVFLYPIFVVLLIGYIIGLKRKIKKLQTPNR
jgi:type III secretory pathway component EscS